MYRDGIARVSGFVKKGLEQDRNKNIFISFSRGRKEEKKSIKKGKENGDFTVNVEAEAISMG